MKFCESTRGASSNRRKAEKWEGMEKGGKEREREINRNRDGKRNRERNEVVNCDRISTNGVVENTCIFFEY